MRWRGLMAIGAVLALVACSGVPPGRHPAAPVATPPFPRYGAEQVVQAFQQAGLPVLNLRDSTRSTQQGRPPRSFDEQEFEIAPGPPPTPGGAPPVGGRIHVFRERQALEEMRAYYASVSAGVPHVYARGNILLALYASVRQETAEQYRAALLRLP